MRTSLVQLHCFCLREKKELLRVRPIGQGFARSRSLHGARRLTSRQSQRGGWARDFDRGFSAQPSLVVRPAWLILVVRQNMKLSWYEASESDIGLLADWNHQLIRDERHRNAMTVDQLADR